MAALEEIFAKGMENQNLKEERGGTMNRNDAEFKQTLKPLVIAVHLCMESQTWLLKFVTETSSTLSDSHKKAILGQIESATGVLELVRQQIDKP